MSIIRGQRFGRLTALEQLADYVAHSGYRKQMWRCQCDCGSIVEAVRADGLQMGSSQSCGCLQRELTVQRSTTHGHSKRGQQTLEYTAWACMMSRCYQPSADNYVRYGGRGVTVCDRWKTNAGGGFENFLSDMGEHPGKGYTLDRIDTNGNYEPSNCKWSTKKEQTKNRSNTRLVVYQGETMTLEEASTKSGIGYFILHNRIKRGWPEERLFAPVRPYQRSAPAETS
jgi:hypothetical protein